MDLEQLTSDLSHISNWGKENMVVLNASKTQFLHLYTRYNLPHNCDIFFESIQFKPSSALNMFLFLVVFLGKITLLLFLNKILRGLVF